MKRSFLVLLVLVAAGAVALVLARRPRPELPNLLLITVDTLRPDHLGCYGYARGTSPAIDRLFTEGAAFRTAIVPRGQTWPTLASLLTSQYPVRHGVRRNGQRLDEEAVTLGHVLSEAGYRCVALLGNSGAAEWPGFDTTISERGKDARLARAAGAWIRDVAREPFFLWVHLFGPHRPFRPPPALAERFDPGYRGPVDGSIEQIETLHAAGTTLDGPDLRHLVALYDGEVRVVDDIVGELVQALEDAGIDERTLVVFTADHGEELGERSFYLSHSASVYDAVLRAPLLFRRPGTLPAGRWLDGVVEMTEVAPTILDLVGIDSPETFQRSSVAGVLRGDAAMPDRPAFSELEDRVVTARTRRFRYVHNPTDFDFPLREGNVYPIDREELFALDGDPGEGVNVAVRMPEEARRLREIVLRWQTEHGWEEGGASVGAEDLPERLRKELEALGYVP